MQELTALLNENEKDSIFNNSVISKYINTCRYAGMKIPKIYNKYFVTYLPFGLDLNQKEFGVLDELLLSARDCLSAKNYKIYSELNDKIGRFSGRNIANIEQKTNEFSFELFERAINRKRKILLLFKNRKEIECIPLGIEEKDKNTYFKIFCKKERLINVNRLSGVRMSEKPFVEAYGGETIVIFKLKGKLAKRYETRPHETLSGPDSEGNVTITNKGEPKEALLSRLMRYDNLCEIISPKSYINDMRDIINNALSNYGV